MFHFLSLHIERNASPIGMRATRRPASKVPTSAATEPMAKDLAAITGWNSIITRNCRVSPGVADRVIFMDQGQIVEQNNPHDFFNNPQNERSKDFLSKILGH